MSLVKRPASIAIDYVASFDMNGNGNNNVGSNNATVTNWSWVTSEVGFQKEMLSAWASTTFTYSSVTYTNSYVWIKSWGSWSLEKNHSDVSATALTCIDWNDYAMLKLYNKTLTDSEEKELYLEGKRKLGQYNHSDLMQGLVGYMDVKDWTTEYWNIIDWTIPTRTAWANTTDQIWYSKAITNPNYSWSLITFTNSYAWIDTGSGYVFTKNDASVTATWINKTGDVWVVFLFNRTLDTSEEDSLEILTSTQYIYPWSKTSLPNLEEGKVLHLNGKNNGTTFYDQSGNGNDGTQSGGVTTSRIGLHEVMTFDGSDDKVNTTANISWYTNVSISAIIKWDWALSHIQEVMNDRAWGWSETWIYIFHSDSANDWEFSVRTVNNNWIWDVVTFPTSFIPVWEYAHICMTYNWSTVSVYKNWVFQDSYSATWAVWIVADIDIWWNAALTWRNFDWQISQAQVYNRALSETEIQQIYYTSFIM